MNAYVTLIIATIAEVIATSALKPSENFTKLVPSLVVIVGYSIAFYSFSFTLKTMPVGIAYALWGGLGMVLIAASGFILFGQKLDWAAVIGIGLILAGVLVINLFSKSTAY